MGYNPHGQLKSSVGKNLSLYSQIGVWLVIALKALAYKELEWLKCLSHEPPLMYDSSMILLSLLTRSRKCFFFRFNTWKIILYLLARSSHLFFLLKSQDSLQGNNRMGLKDLVSILTTLCVVATTRRNGTHSLLTSAKLSVGYLVMGITKELDKEPSLHCSSIYINTRWSMLQQCVYLMSITYPHVFSIRPPCRIHVLWRHTFNLRCTCAHYVYTMRNLCPLTSFLTLTLI